MKTSPHPVPSHTVPCCEYDVDVNDALCVCIQCVVRMLLTVVLVQLNSLATLPKDPLAFFSILKGPEKKYVPK